MEHDDFEKVAVGSAAGLRHGHLRLVAGFGQAVITGHARTSADALAAPGPETRADPRGFERAVRRALQRLAELEED